MQWCMRTSVSSSDAEGGPLSVDSNMGGLYCEIRSSRCMHKDWDVFGCYLENKGVLAEGITYDKILMTFVCHVVCCNVLPRAIQYISRKH